MQHRSFYRSGAVSRWASFAEEAARADRGRDRRTVRVPGVRGLFERIEIPMRLPLLGNAGYVNSSRLTLYAASTVTAVPDAVTMSILP